MQQISPLETAICVADLPRMLDFYTQVLGCSEYRRVPIPAELSGALTLAAAGYLCVWLRTPGGETIKLMSPPDAPARDAAPQQLTARGGLAYLTFYVRDLASVLAAAEARGATLRSARALAEVDSGLRICFFEDPEGNVIELVEPVGN
jgi:catechol 2,3-dioxygenase-like lactoylglutathione lyase family enzyme